MAGTALDLLLIALQVQTLSEQGLRNIGPSVATMASLEGLDAHRRAVTLRLGTDKL